MEASSRPGDRQARPAGGVQRLGTTARVLWAAVFLSTLWTAVKVMRQPLFWQDLAVALVVLTVVGVVGCIVALVLVAFRRLRSREPDYEVVRE